MGGNQDPGLGQETCTAVVPEGEAPPNPLFTPPCGCPRCTPDGGYDRTDGREWLRISGDPQRYRVEVLELGATGRAVLG